MAYCGPRGIPLSKFLSWSQDDQDAALAWAGYESRRCHSCGYHPDEDLNHVHVDVCPGCVRRKPFETDAADTPGAHVRLAHGDRTGCVRCQAEDAAQNPRGR